MINAIIDMSHCQRRAVDLAYLFLFIYLLILIILFVV